jgi:RHS repeat-associated protein
MLFACHVLYGMGSGNEQSVTHEDLYQGSLRALVKRGTNHTVALAAYKDYYPYGQLMPGRNYQTTDYRYGYQGQYAETEPETGFAHFEAREFDSRLGRWMVPDPARQNWSPYLGMGNNPVSGVDPDGQYDTKFGAWLNKFLFGGNKLVYTESRKEWGVEYNPDNGTGEFEVAIRYSGPKLYLSGNARVDWGLQGGFKFNALGAAVSLFASYETKPLGEQNFEWTPGAVNKNERFIYDSYDIIKNYYDYYNTDFTKTELDVGIAALSANNTYGVGTRDKLLSVGPLKSTTISFPIYGKKQIEYGGLGQKNIGCTRRSWGIGFRAAALIGIQGNFEVGYKFSH